MPRTPRNGFTSAAVGQELQRFVSADVERAQRNPAPVQRFGDLAVDGELLLDVRGVLAAEEQELGAHQAGEVGSLGRRGPRVVDRADVGTDPDGHTVAGDRGLDSAGHRVGLPLRERRHPGGEVLPHVGRRVDDELAAGAVHREDGAVGNRQHRGSCADDHRNSLGAQQDHVVCVRAAERQ